MRLRLFAVAAALLASSLAARADLTGDTFQVTYDYPGLSDVYFNLADLTVPNGGNIFGQVFYNVNGSQVIFQYNGESQTLGGPFNGFEFTDLSGDPGIIGVTEDAALSNVTDNNVTFTSDSFDFNLAGLTLSSGDQLVYDISFAPAATPEPSAFLLLGTGLLGLAYALRRRFA